jgi:hypothetical protein
MINSYGVSAVPLRQLLRHNCKACGLNNIMQIIAYATACSFLIIFWFM